MRRLIIGARNDLVCSLVVQASGDWAYWGLAWPRVADEVEDICSTGSWCVKFQVSAVAGDPDKLGGIVEGLNEWLDS